VLELSDINSSEEELLDYYAGLNAQHVTPAWIGGGISIEPQGKACLPQRGVGTLDRVGGKLIGGAIGVIVDLLAGNAGAMIGLRRSHRLDPGLQRQGRRCPCPATAAVALSLVGARRGAP